MIHGRPPLSSLTRTLSDVCMGREPADLVITGGRLVNVHTREVLDGVDVAVKSGRIAMFGDAAHTRGPQTRVLDADGAHLVPGLIDTHMHVESAMVTVGALRRGGPAARHHDGAHRQPRDRQRPRARRHPLDARGGQPAPSSRCCSPSRPASRRCPASRTPARRSRPKTSARRSGGRASPGLGEMMNMPGVIESEVATHEMIGAVLDARLPVTGHWSLHGWDDHRLHAYVAAGVDSDHETVLRSDALAKLRAGMWVQLREGSAWHDVEKLAPVLLEDGVDSRHALLVTDDMHPETLATVGHLNHAVRTAIAAGSIRWWRSRWRRSTRPSTSATATTSARSPPAAARTSCSWRISRRCARTSCWPTARRSAARRRPTSIPPAPATRFASRARPPSTTCESPPAAIGCRCARSAWCPASWPPSTGWWRRRWSTARYQRIRRSTSPRRRASSVTAGRAPIGVGFVQGLGLRARRGGEHGRP